MKRYIAAAFGILLVAGASYYLYQKYNPFTYYDDEVHVHADFLIVINDTVVDLTGTKYQSSAERILHKNVHLHDGEGNVVHRHAEGITFAEFLSSLGYTVTDRCITNDMGETTCSQEESALVLFVNGEPHPNMLTYIPEEEDRILLYYGSSTNPKLPEYLNAITDESCIYSGTCPERGTAPPESCGLTCEL